MSEMSKSSKSSKGGRKSWWSKNAGPKEDEEKDTYENVIKSLKRLYKTGLKPLEDQYNYSGFHSQPLDDADFDAKPMVLLIGQYSTGKTSFIKYILGRDFPGMRVGPEPTTDGFMAIMEGERDKVTGLITEGIIPGHALVSDKSKPFRTLSSFGSHFLGRFQCSSMDNPVLQNITLIDTPGILAGRMEQMSRGYDYTEVLSWFAERADRIILMFDVNKLDTSDEFMKAFEKLMPYEHKIRIILNKCDHITPQQLMRVYGALMWSLGKITATPEVTRVYVGSFWDEKLRFNDNRQLFEDEKKDLFDDLRNLPRDATKRKLNDMISRVNMAKTHAYIISTLKEKMHYGLPVAPAMRSRRKKWLIKNLAVVFDDISEDHSIPRCDFPDVTEFQEKLKNAKFKNFSRMKPEYIEKSEAIFEEAVSLNAAIRHDEASHYIAKPDGMKGGAFNRYGGNPFAHRWGEGVMLGCDLGPDRWIVDEMDENYDELYQQLKGPRGHVLGQKFKQNVQNDSNLTNITLAKIWRLADYDRDGQLNKEEYSLAMHLLRLSKEGHKMPDTLPAHLIPLNQRNNLSREVSVTEANTEDMSIADESDEYSVNDIVDVMETVGEAAGPEEEGQKPHLVYPSVSVHSITGRSVKQTK